jgi:hypothetical protein
MIDFEQIWRSLQNAVLDPYKNTLYYIAPVFGAFSSGYTSINPADCGQKEMIPKAEKFLEEVETLRKCAGLWREVSLYTALNFHFTSFGGALSLTSPILVLPYHRLFRPDKGTFGDGLKQEELARNIETLTDDETRFYITREIGHLKYNDAALKTVAKVIILAEIFCLYTTPIGWAGTITLLGTALTMYLIADKCYECTMDLFAAKVLGIALRDEKKALGAAISALEKQRLANLERREKNSFCHVYLTPSGNNVLDLKHPFLTSRIEKLQKVLEKLS